MINFRIRYERLRDRLRSIRLRRALAAALWLVLLVPLAAQLLALAGRPVLSPALAWTGAALLFAPLAWWLWRRARLVPPELALDRRFRLDELLVTAVEVDRRGPQSAMEARLLDDAAAAIARVGGEQAISSRPVALELERAAGLGLVLAGLALLSLSLQAPDLPTRRTLAPGPGDGPGVGLAARASAGRGGGSASPALRALGAALADQAVAAEAAAALEQGDVRQASRALRVVADRAPRLSEAGRSALSEAMAEAADELAASDPDLASALRQAGYDLSSPNEERAGDGLEALAAELEARSGGGAGQDLEPPTTADAPGALERLSAAPAVMTLEAGESGGARSAGGAAPGTGSAGREAASSGGAAGAPPAALAPPAGGAEAGGVPRPMRDLVRRYFDPSSRAPEAAP